MSIKDNLDMDINEFFKQSESLMPESRNKLLKILIEKYAHLSTADALFDKSDMDMIRQFAQKKFMDMAFPKYLGKNRREVLPGEANVLCIIEATIDYLYSKDCLKKHTKFDYK